MRSRPAARLRSTVLLVLAVAGLPAGASAQGRTLALADYYRLKDAGSPAISPDGSRVAYVVSRIIEDENRSYSEIWLAPSDGSSPGTRITSPSFSASGPVWSRDGRLLAFGSRRPGPEGSTDGGPWLLRMDRPAGEAFQIEGLEGTPLFSPDGRWIAFTRPTPPPAAVPPAYASEFERKTVERFDGRVYDWMNYRFDRRGYLADPRDPAATPPRELYLLPIDGGAARRLTDLGVDVQGAAWSPDASRLAFTADAQQRDEHSYERADLWVVDMRGDVRRVTDDELDYSSPAWSPDGQRIVVRGNESLDVVIREGRGRGAPTDLLVFRPGQSTPIANLTSDWDLLPGSPTWSADGRYVYFTAGVGGDTHLFRVPADGGAVEQVTGGSRRLGGVSFSAGFERMAFGATDPVTPGDVWTAAIDGTEEVRISDVNAEALAGVALSVPERLRFRSADGTAIEGWMLPARGYEPSAESWPMILQIHGGPHGAYGNAFSFEQQLMAANGYMVLFTNPRASTGYGEDFLWATWGAWGQRDYEDVMAGVDHALATYSIDPSRMGVTGYSYGGYLTNWAITQTHRFAAAVSGASISNWVSDYGTSDIPRTKESEFFGPPWEERGLANLLRASPIVHAKGVSTPTLFVHGEYDHRVPIEEGEQMYVALRKQRVPARFVRYPETYHGGWTPWRTVHRMWISLQWWDEWLRVRATSDE